MKLSYQWLKSYVDMECISPKQLSDYMTNAGLEVEGMDYLAQGTNLIIGKVLSCELHPNSDHLHVCQVDIGKETTQIVCGAPNVAGGQKVIVAQVGAQLPQLTIQAGVIRGVASNGMICSLAELGVNTSHLSQEQKEGIEVLADDAVIGYTDPLAYLGLDDVILDVSLTPNRVDCMSMFAMAKEVGAIVDRPVKLPSVQELPYQALPATLKIGSESEKSTLFVGKIIRRLVIKESPQWLKKQLTSYGIKVINNVVDISNYVMLETGQPLHFYDLAKNTAREIIVKDGLQTTYRALDGIEYNVEPNDLMITSQGECLGFAGIMGGDGSKIEEGTTGIIIEAASFHHVSIRNTARRLNLNTEASMRFQKGIEPAAPFIAVRRAVNLLIELADASELEETVVCGTRDTAPLTVEVSVSAMNTHLGCSFHAEEVVAVLLRLDFSPVLQDGNIIVQIPSYRTDIRIPVDVYEEVIRLLGYHRLPSTLPLMSMSVGELNTEQRKRRLMETVLCGLGLQQIVTYTLVSDNFIQHGTMPLANAVSLASPMSEERKFIRSSLLPSVLEGVAYNQARAVSDVNAYEISKVYGQNALEERLSIVLFHQLQALPWKSEAIQSDFYTLKGIIESMLDRLGFDQARIFIKPNSVDTAHFHPLQSAAIYIGRDLLGVFGAIHPSFAKQMDVKRVVMAELSLDVLYKAKAAKVKYLPTPKYPSVKRDFALVADCRLEAAAIVACIQKCGKQLISDVQIFDIYEGEHMAEGKKSIALSVVFQSSEKTLTEADVVPLSDRMLTLLASELQIELRK